MKLEDYEKIWHESLLQKKDYSHQLGIKSDRLKLYQGFIQSHYEGSLQKMFVRIDGHFKPDWYDWSSRYFKKYPAQHFELNSLTLSFPKFLNHLVELGEAPAFLPELAEYELAEFFIYTSASSYLSPESDCLKINPALKILELKFQIGSWVQETDEDNSQAKGLMPLKEDNILAISRNNDRFLCIMTSLSELDLIFIEILKQKSMGKDEIIETFYSIDENLKQFAQNMLSDRIQFLINQHIII